MQISEAGSRFVALGGPKAGLFASSKIGALPIDAALGCLEGHLLGSRFHAWHGRSGRRYIASVFVIDHRQPGDSLPDLGMALLIAVKRHGSARTACNILAMERPSDWARAVAELHAGVDEWHVHLLADDRAARASAVSDLAAQHRIAVVA